ncbi:30S ribosomal protein S1 [endosymbiont of Pachyrhynchus infernalis]|uniref:30S ribosomal protein S1 n=1 Tax=endosymbiont of Pachyrhynchus infernalis TaxID=1971488 RepID=UPI000DC73918|nr:30S ribosomal protein S1 [endosymbiont of Pachyrhynchus infernalis]BBA84757.1 30S ribosomal protein S1 [endosymbiont of Pachyrhynchus infernalis]
MIKNFSNFFKKSVENINVQPGEILKGKVINIFKDFILVDVNLKSESYVPINEFIDNDKLNIKIGDEIDFILESIDNNYGETIISRDKAKQYEYWNELEEYYKCDKSIYGYVIERIKGGFSVEINNVRAFLPGSLVDFKSISDSYNLEGKKLEFKVVKIDKKTNNIVVSRKAVIESEDNYEKKNLINNLKKDDIVKGIVKNITNYGVFLDLGGIDGLLHITDITWKRIKHPSEIVKIGDEINVKIIKFDYDKFRVYLGLKQLVDDPWYCIIKKYPKGLIISGKVTNLTDYGCFVEIENGIEGLVHISEMDWRNKNINPYEIVNLNEVIKVMILNIDISKRRISLGIKQCKKNPWNDFYKKYKIGDIVIGNIKSITNFGIFIELNNENVDGLVHITDISWLIDKNNDINKYSKGDEIKSIILNIDTDKNRISLGIKQLFKDPFEDFINIKSIGDIIPGKIIDINNNNLIIYINDYVLGNYNLDLNTIKNKDDIYIGNILNFKIHDFDIKNRIIICII